MGSGKWDTTRYHSDRATRVSTGTADFAYTATAVKTHKIHDDLDPLRINHKPFGKLESRDSVEHPNSNAVFVAFDVTGSNYERAVDAQKKLPNLMDLLGKYLTDPQLLVAANDDYTVVGRNAIQISDYESDNRIDEHIRNIWLVRNGGGNDGESYDLLLYAAARKTVTDCFEKRGKKGYYFMYADEPIFEKVTPSHVSDVFGESLQESIPIAEIIEEVQRQYHTFVIWPERGYEHARAQYVKLFGEESVLTLQHPNLICEMIGSVIGLNEGRVSSDGIVRDLIEVGSTKSEASSVSQALARMAKLGDLARGTGSLPDIGEKAKGASRL